MNIAIQTLNNNDPIQPTTGAFKSSLVFRGLRRFAWLNAGLCFPFSRDRPCSCAVRIVKAAVLRLPAKMSAKEVIPWIRLRDGFGSGPVTILSWSGSPMQTIAREAWNSPLFWALMSLVAVIRMNSGANIFAIGKVNLWTCDGSIRGLVIFNTKRLVQS